MKPLPIPRTSPSKQIGLSKGTLVAQALEHDIRRGRMAQGDRLESESALMNRFSVSRNTVRKGLETLARRGLIVTRGGIGSFVTFQGVNIDSNLGWTQALSLGGQQIETRSLGIRKAPCGSTDSFLREKGPEPTVFGGTYLCIDRVRFCCETKKGISLERSRLPWRDAFLDIPQEGLINGSLMKTLARLGLSAASGSEWVGIIGQLSEEEALAMERDAQQPMLRLRRLTRTDSGDLLEYVDSILDPDRFGLHLEF